MKSKKIIIINLIFVFFQWSLTEESCHDDPAKNSAHKIALKKAGHYQAQKEYTLATEWYQTAFQSGPCSIQAYFNCAYCYTMIGKSGHAIATYKKILQRDPNNVSVLYNIAYILKMEGLIDQALPIYKKIIKLDPKKEEAYFGMGMAYITKGDFENGWRIHERYLKRTGRNAEKLRDYLKNNNIEGKSILLIPEGGLGDSIHFLRYAKKLKEIGAHVIVSVQKELYPLVQSCQYIDELLKTGDQMTMHIDDKTTLMSIPAIWYSAFQEIAHEVNYITPDPLLSLYWKNQLKKDRNFKIGICWGASVYNDSSRPPIARRSIPLSKLYTLAELPNVSLYSLQRFDGEEELNDVPDTITIHTFGDHFDRTHGPFMDTAAIIPHLDLVVCVDSATAHLAGALSKKVFLMLPYSTDWRWIAGRNDTPWYPSMRIFKQKDPFDWDFVVTNIKKEIEFLITPKQK